MGRRTEKMKCEVTLKEKESGNETNKTKWPVQSCEGGKQNPYLENNAKLLIFCPECYKLCLCIKTLCNVTFTKWLSINI